APGIAHVTQLCIAPDRQGHVLGRYLMDASLEGLRGRGYRGVSLTVTAENESAVRLYRRLRFDVIKGFAAFARTLA
ncbi:MAG: GNAT family N-acetyltransferase, partial [Acidobacteria bacterium]|nr:GNAT family N-acetyltransferase [Acidobacteriota bacterium]